MTTELTYALAYARLGWRIIPIRPGSKAPLGIERWQELATNDPAQITAWWGEGGRHQGWGIGLACGEGSGVWALDVDPRHGGDETLAQLEVEHGELPDTVEAITGGGGRHLLFAWPTLPEGVTLANQAGKLGPGLDAKAEGGQIVIAPTLHPETGRAYEWEVEHLPGDVPVASAPHWLIDLATSIKSEELTYAEGSGTFDPEFAIDNYNHQGDINQRSVDLLTQAGWRELKRWRGKVYMERPGQTDRGKHGATVGAVAPGVAYIFTDGGPPLVAGKGYRPFDLYAELVHAGDRVHADVTLCRQGWGHVSHAEAFALAGYSVGDYVAKAMEGYEANASTPTTDDEGQLVGWVRSDITEVLRRLNDPAYEPEQPSVGRLTQAPEGKPSGLWYSGRVNALYGESGIGKTWVMLGTAAQVLKDGGAVAWVDMEEPVLGVVTRLRQLGVRDDALTARFHHYGPDTRLMPGDPFYLMLAQERPQLVVVDSTGEALALEGAKPNDDDEVASWFRRWCRRFAELSGACVLVSDHVVKNRNERGMWAGGSQRKRAAITGSAYMADVLVPFGKGVAGRLKLTCAKDRLGNYRQGEHAATFVLDERSGFGWGIEPPSDEDSGEGGPTAVERIAEQAWALLNERYPDEATERALRPLLEGKHDLKPAALDLLTTAGCATRRLTAKGHAYYKAVPEHPYTVATRAA